MFVHNARRLAASAGRHGQRQGRQWQLPRLLETVQTHMGLASTIRTTASVPSLRQPMFRHSVEGLVAYADHVPLRRHQLEPDAQTSSKLASTTRTTVSVPNPKEPTSGRSARKLVVSADQLRNSSRDRHAWTQAAIVNTTRIKDIAQEVMVATSGHSARKLAASADVGSGQV